MIFQTLPGGVSINFKRYLLVTAALLSFYWGRKITAEVMHTAKFTFSGYVSASISVGDWFELILAMDSTGN